MFKSAIIILPIVVFLNISPGIASNQPTPKMGAKSALVLKLLGKSAVRGNAASVRSGAKAQESRAMGLAEAASLPEKRKNCKDIYYSVVKKFTDLDAAFKTDLPEPFSEEDQHTSQHYLDQFNAFRKALFAHKDDPKVGATLKLIALGTKECEAALGR